MCRLTRKAYAEWFTATTSLLRNTRNKMRADNAVHSTIPDRLVGPLQVVETRRAKYVGISKLSTDFMSTEVG